jgi:iron-sulfur cluster assembly accessory protein
MPIKKNKSVKLITKEMPIGEIIQKYPQAADIFVKYGLHCIGCSMIGWETLEQGCQAHGLDNKSISKMVEEANSYAADFKDDLGKNEIMNITTRATNRVKELIKSEDGMKYLRIAVFGIDAVHRFGFKFEKTKKKGDSIVEKNGVNFLIDKKSAEKISGSTMDYLSFMPGNGFKIYPAKNA